MHVSLLLRLAVSATVAVSPPMLDLPQTPRLATVTLSGTTVSRQGRRYVSLFFGVGGRGEQRQTTVHYPECDGGLSALLSYHLGRYPSGFALTSRRIPEPRVPTMRRIRGLLYSRNATSKARECMLGSLQLSPCRIRHLPTPQTPSPCVYRPGSTGSACRRDSSARCGSWRWRGMTRRWHRARIALRGGSSARRWQQAREGTVFAGTGSAIRGWRADPRASNEWPGMRARYSVALASISAESARLKFAMVRPESVPFSHSLCRDPPSARSFPVTRFRAHIAFPFDGCSNARARAAYTDMPAHSRPVAAMAPAPSPRVFLLTRNPDVRAGCLTMYPHWGGYEFAAGVDFVTIIAAPKPLTCAKAGSSARAAWTRSRAGPGPRAPAVDFSNAVLVTTETPMSADLGGIV
ncbi:hypothetical protein C8R44DRAFT_752571 [Mycena epipterygia]|nr:hypothetical protein C8R44DRAFT_752571 [Mycena epipterygia]